MIDDLKWVLDTLTVRALDYTTYANYYNGAHKLSFATDKFRSAFGSLLKAFADNLCSVVVDTVADRLQVTGFAPEKAADETSADAAWDIWRANRMDRRSGEVHLEALRSGDAYLIVWPEDGWGPRLYPNSGSACCVEYDTERPGEVIKAGKVWLDNAQRWRLNLYYRDRIEKYATLPPSYTETSYAPPMPTSSGAFQPFEVPGEPWPLPNPYDTVPVFHFANNATTGALGRSELADVVALQDALNKSVADMLVAMEFVALPQRWVTGIEVDIDETTGLPRAPFVPGADRIWTVGAPDARFGQFDAANLTQFIDVQNSFRMEVARVSRTPLHHLMPTGEYPSGEAMKTAEEPLLAKVRDRQIAWGNVWEDALTLALRMAGVEGAELSCNWLDPTPRNTRSFVEVLLLKQQLGVSQQQLLREAGYSESEIEAMQAEKQAAQEALGEQLLTAFERGDPPAPQQRRDTERP